MGPQQPRALLFMSLAVPKKTAHQLVATLFFLPLISHPNPIRLSRPLHLIMLTTQVPCRGCGRLFTPRGLSQHVSKTQDPRCRSAVSTSRVPTASSSDRNAAIPPPPNTNNAVVISNDIEGGGDDFGDAYNAEILDGALFATTRGAVWIHLLDVFLTHNC